MVGLGSIICFTALSDIELLRAWYDSLCPIRRSSDTSSLHKLHLECDGDLLAHQNAASFKGRIPGQAIVFAVNLGRARNSHTSVAPWIFHRRRRSFHREDDLAGNPVDRQVTFHCQFAITDNANALGLE